MATTNPPQPASAAPARYEIRRRHDASLISAHCCAPSALQAFDQLAWNLAEIMGPNPPGPLEWAEADIIDLATGDSVASTGTLVPLDGQPPSSGTPTSDHEPRFGPPTGRPGPSAL